MEFKVGDRVKLTCCRRWGSIVGDKEIFCAREHYTVLLDGDSSNCLIPKEDLELVDKNNKTQDQQKIEELEKRIEKLELYIKPTNERPIQYKTNIEEIEKQVAKNIEEIKSAIGEQNKCEKSENVSSMSKNSLLTEDERVILRNLDKKWEWIARDEDGMLCVYNKIKPHKFVDMWKNDVKSCDCEIFAHLFQFIKWGDDEPYNIEELLKGKCGNE